MLSENTIMQLSRKIGKRHQISLMNVGTTDNVYMDFEPSGNIRIYGECKTPKLPYLGTYGTYRPLWATEGSSMSTAWKE